MTRRIRANRLRARPVRNQLSRHPSSLRPRTLNPQLPGLLGIYFYDPNGIRLEFACQPEDGEAPEVLRCVTQTKAEAAAELSSLPGVTPAWIEERLAELPE